MAPLCSTSSRTEICALASASSSLAAWIRAHKEKKKRELDALGCGPGGREREGHIFRKHSLTARSLSTPRAAVSAFCSEVATHDFRTVGFARGENTLYTRPKRVSGGESRRGRANSLPSG